MNTFNLPKEILYYVISVTLCTIATSLREKYHLPLTKNRCTLSQSSRRTTCEIAPTFIANGHPEAMGETYSNSGEHAFLLQRFRHKRFEIHHLPHILVHGGPSHTTPPPKPHGINAGLNHRAVTPLPGRYLATYGSVKNRTGSRTRKGRAMPHAMAATTLPGRERHSLFPSMQRKAAPGRRHAVWAKAHHGHGQRHPARGPAKRGGGSTKR